MDKIYQAQKFEDKIYRRWEKSGAFQPAGKSRPFTIIMPPPNANDPLHIGHAMFVTIEDIFIRFQRMRGKAALWLPGTDHAGIETQYVFEKKLAKEGKSRFDYDRKKLYRMIWDYVAENSGVAIGQMKKLGAAADWSRTKFTLNQDVVDFVLDTFIKLYKDNLVYRDLKLVNYCTRCGTAFSNLEINHREEKNKLYYVKYKLTGGGEISVATTRPETIFADVAIAINPRHKKASELKGKKAINPLTGTEMPIIEDRAVDIHFGTGLLKITPCHDKTDWEIWKRHEKEVAKPRAVIDLMGRMTGAGEDFEGLRAAAAREKVLERLNVDKVDTNYGNNVSACYRCNRTIEPLPLKQFFIRVKPLVKKALAALNKKQVKIYGPGREKILRHWLMNLDDWNISRQIVWGIRIPVWYKKNSNGFIVSKTSPGKDYVQDTDTFDTWFSSAQWPVVTLKTGRPGDFKKFYPTSVMETGYDILPFWVMRMLLMGIYLTGKVPFKQVYLHGLIRDTKGQKMSKSKGNVLNPLVAVNQYGADALRMALVMSTTAGRDNSVGEAKIRGMRNLTNKIWNAARFVLAKKVTPSLRKGASLKDTPFKKELRQTVKQVTKQLEELKPGQAAETVYNKFWHWFCDQQIEAAKAGKISPKTLLFGLRTFLKLLHPFVPFVTEAVWQQLPATREKLLIQSRWPNTV